jgi:TatD DNase family protein
MLVDSHCHLDFPGLVDDLDGVVARAGAADVGTMLTISTKLSTFDTVLGIARSRENIWCSVGIHPHEAASEAKVSADDLVALAADDKVIGIGETGLDYFYEHSPRDDQQSQFRAHIGAARQTGLPLIVHTRDADADTIGILAEEMAAGPYPGLIHCFSSSRELAEKSVELGLHISVSGIVTFKKAEELRETLRDVPLDRLLVETDSPYLAPVPKRGKPNEPSYVAYTANTLAEVKGVSPAELAAATTDNFFRLFGKAQRPASRPAPCA